MSDWHTIKDKLPNVHAGKYRVKLHNGTETNAYFYQDATAWILFYRMKNSHWWYSDTHEGLDNVTHWRECEPTDCQKKGID